MYQSSIYVDSMIEQRRTAGLDRELEHRRIAIERGTMNPARPGLVQRLAALIAHRSARPARTQTAVQPEVRHA